MFELNAAQVAKVPSSEGFGVLVGHPHCSLKTPPHAAVPCFCSFLQSELCGEADREEAAESYPHTQEGCPQGAVSPAALGHGPRFG